MYKHIPKRIRYGKARRRKHPILLKWVARGDLSPAEQQKLAHISDLGDDGYHQEGREAKARDLERYHDKLIDEGWS